MAAALAAVTSPMPPSAEDTEQAVKCLKAALDAALRAGSPPGKVVATLQALRSIGRLSPKVIKDTGIGIAVNHLAKTGADDAVRAASKALVDEWRQALRKQIAELKGNDPAGGSAQASSGLPEHAAAAAEPSPQAKKQLPMTDERPSDPPEAAEPEDAQEPEPEIKAKISVRTEYVVGERMFTACLESPALSRRFMAPQRKNSERSEADGKLLRLLGERSPVSDDLAARWRKGDCTDREVMQQLKKIPVQKKEFASALAKLSGETDGTRAPAAQPRGGDDKGAAAEGEDEGGEGEARPKGARRVLKRPAGKAAAKGQPVRKKPARR